MSQKICLTSEHDSENLAEQLAYELNYEEITDLVLKIEYKVGDSMFTDRLFEAIRDRKENGF